MDLPDAAVARLFAAGADAVEHNAPLGPERARGLAARVAAVRPSRVVDLGCGRGTLTCLLAQAAPEAAVTGIDTDDGAVEHARRRAVELGLDDRVRFEIADATAWTPEADVVAAVGVSHAFGGAAPMLEAAARLAPSGLAIVGDGVWQAPPDDWCRETFGDLPADLDALVGVARSAGWTVVAHDTSTLDEWDAFEHTWIAGAQAIGGRHPEVTVEVAAGFAAQRQADYQRYRGVLGFAWLVLSR